MDVPDYFDLAFTSSVQDAIWQHRKNDRAFRETLAQLGDQVDLLLESLNEEQKEILDQVAERYDEAEIVRNDLRYRQGMIDGVFLLRFMGLLHNMDERDK